MTVGYADKKSELVMGKGGGQDWREVAFVNGQLAVISAKNLVLNDTNMVDLGVSVGEVVSGGGFGNYIYVLDKGNGEIWKYSAKGESSRWLKGNAVTDLLSSVDLSIDGDVWIGTSNSQVLRFRRGNKERFSLSSPIKDIKIDKIAVNTSQIDSEGRISILDSEKERVLVFDKNGVYVEQLLWSGFKEAKDLLFVSETDLVVLAQGKLWKVSL